MTKPDRLATCLGLQSLDQDARPLRFDERSAGGNPDRRATGQQDLRQRQRAAVVVGSVDATPGPAGKIQQPIAPIAAVADPGVTRPIAAQPGHRLVAYPRFLVDQHVVLGRERAARPGIDRIRPQHDRRPVGRTPVLFDEIPIPRRLGKVLPIYTTSDILTWGVPKTIGFIPKRKEHDMAGRAYSYQRCSNPSQTEGDTKRRQTEPLLTRGADYCRRKGLTLDETQTFADWGISSFHGDNVVKGALGAFLAAIDKKVIGKGDVLIVEAIDRLTRLPLDDADQLLRRILKSGVSIVTLNPEFEIAPDSLNDLGKRMMLLAYCEVAHRSSADKSKWLCGAWERKRRDATHANKKMTKSCPRWLELSEDRTHFIEIPESVATVKMIFRWYLDGLGAHTITLRLNREKIPALAKGKMKRQHWHAANVQKMLSNVAVTGRFQLHKGTHDRTTPVGDPIPDYFPRIISDADFRRVQRRKALVLSGRSPKRFVTLFPRLVKDARDKAIMSNIHNGKKAVYRLVSSLARRGVGAKFATFPYQALEDAFLTWTSEFTADDLMPPEARENRTSEVEERQLRIDELDRRIEEFKVKMDRDPRYSILADKVVQWSEQRDKELEALEQLRTRTTKAVGDGLRATQTLIAALRSAPEENKNELRLRLRARIAELVKEIWILPYDVEVPKKQPRTGNKRQRVADVQVFFRDGGIRTTCIIPGHIDQSGQVGPKHRYRPGDTYSTQDLRNYDPKTYTPLLNLRCGR